VSVSLSSFFFCCYKFLSADLQIARAKVSTGSETNRANFSYFFLHFHRKQNVYRLYTMPLGGGGDRAMLMCHLKSNVLPQFHHNHPGYAWPVWINIDKR
jgi:hypothetical protein